MTEPGLPMTGPGVPEQGRPPTYPPPTAPVDQPLQYPAPTALPAASDLDGSPRPGRTFWRRRAAGLGPRHGFAPADRPPLSDALPTVREASSLAPTQTPPAPPAAAEALVPAFPPPHPTVPPTVPPPPTTTGAIATLPPIEAETTASYPVSPRTGRPQRPVLVGITSALFWAAAAVTTVAYAWLWWTAASVTGLPQAARVFAWTNPDPVSVLAVSLVVATALLTVIVVAACGALAYNVWNGRSWTRIGGLIVLAITASTYVLHPYAWIAAIPAAIGAALVWTPPVARFNTAMTPPPAPPDRVAVDRHPVRYGRQPLAGDPT